MARVPALMATMGRVLRPPSVRWASSSAPPTAIGPRATSPRPTPKVVSAARINPVPSAEQASVHMKAATSAIGMDTTTMELPT